MSPSIEERDQGPPPELAAEVTAGQKEAETAAGQVLDRLSTELEKVENQGTDKDPKGPVVDDHSGENIIAPWDAEGQEILERAAIRLEALFEIAQEARDVEEEILQEEVEVLELLVERGRGLLE